MNSLPRLEHRSPATARRVFPHRPIPAPPPRRRVTSAALVGAALALCWAGDHGVAGGSELRGEPMVAGDYLEVRDELPRLLGPVDGRGGSATAYRTFVAWHIERGEWNGVDLTGLAAVAHIESEGRPKSPFEGRLRTVLHVDERASPEQHRALVALVAELAPRYAKALRKVHRSKITFSESGEEVACRVDGKMSLRVELHEHGDAACQSVCGRDPQPLRAISSHIRGHGAKTLERSLAAEGPTTASGAPEHGALERGDPSRVAERTEETVSLAGHFGL